MKTAVREINYPAGLIANVTDLSTQTSHQRFSVTGDQLFAADQILRDFRMLLRDFMDQVDDLPFGLGVPSTQAIRLPSSVTARSETRPWR
jgi:hypothetical protein